MVNETQAIIDSSSILFSVCPFPLTSIVLQAYIDPGTGSLIIQVLIASFIGGLFLIKVFWRKVRGFFGNLFSKIGKDG